MRILSGIQPTGEKHLGNFIGAIRQYVRFQDDGEAFYFIVDLHALTVQPDPELVRSNTLRTAALLLAAGLDPDRCSLFVQSHVGGEHSELAWLLGCVGTYGELRRMTQFKDKSEGREGVSVGLFTYPVLQAADILLYDVDAVPIGDDQRQHLELARNIAERFNQRYGKTFVLPGARVPEVGGRIMDLQDPTRKMSTTNGSPKGTVYVLDEPDAIMKKFRSAVTDSGSEVFASDDKPGITNLLSILSVASGRSVDDLEHQYRDLGYGTFKPAAAEAVIEFLRPVRERFHELIADRTELERVLAAGAERAHELASAKVAQVKERMGCLVPAEQASTRR